MADDAAFIPPLGDFTPPTIHQQADALAGELVRLLGLPGDFLEPVEVDGAVGRREGEPWFPIVWAEACGHRWLMTPQTAREIGQRLARLGPGYERLFTAAADQADGLAKQHNDGD